MRSTVTSAIVPCTSAIGAACMSSTASPTRETRAGGKWSSPELRSFDPTNPYFHASLRPDTDAEMRSGSGRRGGSSVTVLRHDKNLPYVIGAPCAIWVATGRADPTEVLGDDRPVGVAADEDRGRAVAALCLVRTRGQARTPIGGDDQHVAAGVERASQRARS